MKTAPDRSSEEILLEAQAESLEVLLPRLMRQVFTIDPEHPTAEMPLAQLRLCSTLMHSTHSLSGIAEELGVSVSAATQIADRLEKTGLVERISCTEDRRVKRLQLTPQGAEVMESRRQTRVQHVRLLLEHLREPRRNEVIAAIEEMLEAAQRSRGGTSVSSKTRTL